MKAIILAGGLGTRLQEVTTVIPKPMVEIGGRPILWHIMKIFESHGINEFGVALGYKGAVIKDFFLHYSRLNSNFTIDLATGDLTSYGSPIEQWKVHLMDTGQATDTGGRVRRMRDLIGNEPFLLTYGDGVADVDVTKLIEFHKSHGKLATVTAVRPPGRFGALELDNDEVRCFVEKPAGGEAWINGGFFVLDPKVIDYIDGDSTAFEREPIERISAEGQLMAYRHPGFWQCMDTLRDMKHLNDMWDAGKAPWKNWADAPLIKQKSHAA